MFLQFELLHVSVSQMCPVGLRTRPGCIPASQLIRLIKEHLNHSVTVLISESVQQRQNW